MLLNPICKLLNDLKIKYTQEIRDFSTDRNKKI